MQGRMREVALNQLFKPLLPSDVTVGTGKIVDADGRQSAQTDVVIYSPRLLPALLYAPEEGLFPVEACFFAIEVKTTVSAAEVRSSIEKIRRLRELQLSSGNTGGGVPMAVTTLLFAYDTDLAVEGTTELERYRSLDPDADTAPLIEGICVVGRGYWIFSRPGGSHWFQAKSTVEHDEVIDFLGGVVNSLPEKMAARGLPSLGNYLLEDKTPTRI